MAVVLTYAASVPVVKVGRIAGQYAKPRSSDLETRDGVTLPAYRGDAVNGFDFTPSRASPTRSASSTSTTPRPRRSTWSAPSSPAATPTCARCTPGTPTSCASRRPASATRRMAGEIDRALAFMNAIGADPEEFHRVDFHSSHEALLLEYEHALTRIDSRTELPYDVSGHFVWIGERTRQLDGAHVESPPHPQPDRRQARPDHDRRRRDRAGRQAQPRQRGRAGSPSSPASAPARSATACRRWSRRSPPPGVQVAWICDPMHGNTFEASSGYKTRRFDDVIDEVQGFFDVHRSLGTWPGGVHVELTGDDVTECVGGGEELAEVDLGNRYESVVRPAPQPGAVARAGVPRRGDAARRVLTRSRSPPPHLRPGLLDPLRERRRRPVTACASGSRPTGRGACPAGAGRWLAVVAGHDDPRSWSPGTSAATRPAR